MTNVSAIAFQNMQWVLLAAVVVGLSVVEFRILRDRARLAVVREAVKKEAVVYRTPISAQWRRGWWGRGNAKGMQLVVREHSFELSYAFPGARFLSEEWFCTAPDARMTTGEGRFLPPQINRECIVLSIPSIDNTHERQEILLSSLPPGRRLRAAWDALVVCGVLASGDPPQDRS
jgi:hypothetical protein